MRVSKKKLHMKFSSVGYGLKRSLDREEKNIQSHKLQCQLGTLYQIFHTAKMMELQRKV